MLPFFLPSQLEYRTKGQYMHKKGQRTYQLKCCTEHNKHENISVVRQISVILGFWLSIFWIDLVRFYGISTIVDNLMPNHVYPYILNI